MAARKYGCWEAWEDTLITHHYPLGSGYGEMKKMMPGRTVASIQARARQLGVRRPKELARVQAIARTAVIGRGWKNLQKNVAGTTEEINRRFEENMQLVFDEALGRHVKRFPAGYALGAQPQRGGWGLI